MLIPCIDLQNGMVVQLIHGRKRELAIKDVLGVLEKFKDYEWLHIIDLDAAMGKTSNAQLAQKLCFIAHSSYGMKVRLGGGIRTVARAVKVAKWKPEQIIIGSAAFREGKVNLPFLKRLVKQLDPGRIVIALDTADGHITTQGWRRRLTLRAEDVMAQVQPFCAAFLCTDVDREGTLSGANLKFFRSLRNVTDHPVIAAGGIKTRREVLALGKIGMDAAVGMAMYKDILR
ncbi:MAG: phosphoribosylformimino-5-aminoimidazole carboxamide ribotide isomerase [Acidobacteriaceae bacterium]|jgi:phosphoribosylformimino-5-aminoimidazole carboxamide ribonucleotide (ProFAR) isomerase|nr:phosphoribosylformimino-5-aminoimidazole carboxamide ribotide isomerase [Acidobacteriaceae bacterium]